MKKENKEKNKYAVELGRLGGLASAKKLTRLQKIERARNAGRHRWGKPKEKLQVELTD